MPSLKAIRLRIGSVKNTQKITRAMKLVAAARLRRAQESIVAARPYAKALSEVISEAAARSGEGAHPLLATGPVRKVELIPITSDRGLAGAFNSQVNRATERFIYEHPDYDVEVGVVGRKGRDYLRRRKVKLTHEFAGATSQTAHARAKEIAARAVGRFLSGEVDAVYIVYNEFKSAISQKVQVEQLLPIVPKSTLAAVTDYVYEPDQATVLEHVLPMWLEVEIFRALLESIASEFGARMSAMDNATNNASDMIGRLTLQYNRARQAAITKELLEIIGGAEALKG